MQVHVNGCLSCTMPLLSHTRSNPVLDRPDRFRVVTIRATSTWLQTDIMELLASTIVVGDMKGANAKARFWPLCWEVAKC